jgi:hypothetical protein
MASKKADVRLTANFEDNLATIEVFCAEESAPQVYDSLLDALLQRVIPNLERFPQMGASFLARQGRSVEGRVMIRRLNAAIGRGEIREYLFEDYLVLYAIIDDTVYLLSIKHHRQLSFDLEAFWLSTRPAHDV